MLAFMGLGPMEVLVILVFLGVVAAGVVLFVVLANQTKKVPDRLSSLEDENERLRLELENQKLKDAIQKRKKNSD
jgi:uncharacterized protein HemX